MTRGDTCAVLQESRPAEDPADLIFMEPDLLVEHPSDEAYCIAQGRAVNAVRIFRGTHPDAIFLSKEIKSLAIPPQRRIADIIKVPLPLAQATRICGVDLGCARSCVI